MTNLEVQTRFLLGQSQIVFLALPRKQLAGNNAIHGINGSPLATLHEALMHLKI